MQKVRKTLLENVSGVTTVFLEDFAGVGALLA